jgi:FKBP-type peptidyl-prolyl cis-trans isomerase
VFKDEKDMIADYQSSLEKEKDAEVKSLEEYMKAHNLKGVKTPNGAFAVIENPGDQSAKGDTGKVVSIMYKGYLQSNGKVFDTNMDTTKGHTAPYQFAVGSRRTIAGWNEALPYFGKGGKGKILVPAMLAYGPQDQGPDIPAFSNLIFDIELLNVEDAPPQAPQNGEQQMVPQNQPDQN